MKVQALVFVLVVASVSGQETVPTVTTSPTTTTANPGQGYGEICNGLLLRCDTHGGSVGCFHRETNATTGLDECETGLNVDFGLCRCVRNCGTDGIFHETGEYNEVMKKCVGLVGQRCNALTPDCTFHASCNFLTSQCVCMSGYVPTADGLRCEQAP